MFSSFVFPCQDRCVDAEFVLVQREKTSRNPVIKQRRKRSSTSSLCSQSQPPVQSANTTPIVSSVDRTGLSVGVGMATAEVIR